ncbi:MAG: pseudaminic acid synthase [Stygiobacter sp.]|nr:MAG: pseudaminic acid synthase [Stygiobacter sp.]KAF0218164.1 MAG: pseudaminic acid [Ignavibacteria bacterium]
MKTNTASIHIAEREISEQTPAFIIAELSANHGQDFEVAIKTIKAAKEAGADAIKLQTYTADTITIDSNKEFFQVTQGTIWDGTTLYKLYQKAYTPWEWQPKLKQVAEELGLICFSSPFDKTAVDFLEQINVPAYKIASFEIVDIPLVEYVASKGKPVILSTGIAGKEEVAEAVEICRKVGNNQIALLKCTSAYPTPLDQVNLMTLTDIKESFKTVVGISDHTMSSLVSVASIPLGARIIEKHFVLDRGIDSPDSSFSLTPDEFKSLVKDIRDTEKILGSVTYELTEKSKRSREHARSLFVVENIKAGEIFTESNVRSIRPAFGLHTRHLTEILGKQAKVDIEKGTPLKWELVV